MELDDDAYWINMNEAQIKLTPWFINSQATYEQLFAEDKAGVHLMHRPDDAHHEYDKQWAMVDEDGDDVFIDAFQACLFEDGSEVPGRYHGLPNTSQKRFLGFNQILEHCNAWFKPWMSRKARYRFHEALRQHADLYPSFRTQQYYTQVLRLSNVLYHPYALFASEEGLGVPQIPVIWQTPWLRENVTMQQLEAWILTGVWPMLQCNKVQLSLELYLHRSKEHMMSLSANKRPRETARKAGRTARLLYKETSAQPPDALSNHPVKGLQLKRSRGAAAGAAVEEEEEPNTYKGKYKNMEAADMIRQLEVKDNMLATQQRDLADVNLRLTETTNLLTETTTELTETKGIFDDADRLARERKDLLDYHIPHGEELEKELQEALDINKILSEGNDAQMLKLHVLTSEKHHLNLQLKEMQQKMSSDTVSMEKGVDKVEEKYKELQQQKATAERKFQILKKQYSDLQQSCDKDVANFEAAMRDMQAKSALSSSAPMQVDGSKTAKMSKTELNKSAPPQSTSNASFETDYSHPDINDSRLLTITEVSYAMTKCLDNMKECITQLKNDSSLDKQQKSDKYFEQCANDMQLLHEVMGDWGQKAICFPESRNKRGRRAAQKCVCCGKEDGGWDAMHNRADPSTGSRECPHKGTICTICKRYGLVSLDNKERYTQHTAEACPLKDIECFARKVEAQLAEKHQPDVKALSHLSAFDEE